MTLHLPSARPSDLLTVVLLGATFAVGLAAPEVVPATMTVHYTPPGGVYYGPETLPRAVALWIIPTVSLLTVVVLRSLPALDAVDLPAPARTLYRSAVVVTVGLLAAAQVGLVLLNLA